MRDHGNNTYSQQLDFLRGIAIVLMIINHVGIRLLNSHEQQQGLLGAIVFFGSFAPVVFFFTTGFGIGIAKRKVTVSGFRSTFLKAALLLLADQMMFWVNAVPLGLDFLGFIAFSSVLVTAVAACKRPQTVCGAVIAVALVLRFGIGPWLHAHQQLHVEVAWLFGVSPIDGISYPFSPWVVYPMLGFLMAYRYTAARDLGKSFLWPWVSAPGIVSLGLTAILYRAHAVFFRWGTVSFAFFVLSIAVISVCILCAWHFWTNRSLLPRLLSLRGISSLAVVPIHFALIEILVALGVTSLSEPNALITMAMLIAVSIFLARSFAVGVNGLVPNTVVYPLVALVIFSVITIWLISRPFFAIFAAMVIGQLSIAALIAVRDRSRTVAVRGNTLNLPSAHK